MMRSGSGYLTALAAVIAVSLLISLVEQHAHLANISMLYLIAVLATATAFGRGPAIVAAVAAFLVFNWFFVNPVHTLTVDDPTEWVTLLLFLVTAAVTGELAGALRHRAREAEEREREAIRLRREATEAEVLRQTGELKDALLNAVSHNLRTPLASIITWAGSLRQRDIEWTEPERQEVAEAIEQEAVRLNHIVGNLLDLSRIQAGSLAPAKEWHDLRDLIDDVAGRLEGMTAQHVLRVEVPDDLPPVALDWVQIDQVLTNLLENAVKHTPAGTRIRVAAVLMEREILVSVQDSGPGLSSEVAAHLFDPFVQGRRDHAASGGTGLGLAIAKGLVEAHGGRLWVDRRIEGGACFVFSLPVACRPDRVNEPAP